jgi:hypothetical protein
VEVPELVGALERKRVTRRRPDAVSQLLAREVVQLVVPNREVPVFARAVFKHGHHLAELVKRLTFRPELVVREIKRALVVDDVAVVQREKLSRLMAVNSLFSEDRIVENFISMDTMFENVTLTPQSDTVHRLLTGAPMVMPAGFTTWARDRAVTGIMVVQDGIIRHESYPLIGVNEDAPANSTRISWSMAKSFLNPFQKFRRQRNLWQQNQCLAASL